MDGPPGTGKSYTITAIVYLANQLGKSVVITSHKKQALDVIDQVLTEQFKNLHPKSKPSILRIQRASEPQSLNSLQNTLSTVVINAARSRSQTMNQEAVAHDRLHLVEEIKEDVDKYWKEITHYDEAVQKTFELARLQEVLFGPDPVPSDVLPARLPEGTQINLDRIQNLLPWLANVSIPLSLEALLFFSKNRDGLPDILSKCEQLNQLTTILPDGIIVRIESVPVEFRPLKDLVDQLLKYLQNNTPLNMVVLDGLNLTPPSDIDRTLFPSYEVLIEVRGDRFTFGRIRRKVPGESS